MRFFTLWVLGIWLLCPFDLAQSTLDFDFNDEPLDLAVEELAGQSQVPVIGRADQLAGYRVTAHCSGCSVEQALDALLESTPFVWEQLDGQYIIVDPRGKFGEIRGTVSMKGSNQPLGGIPIWLISRKAKSQRHAWLETTTSGRGQFQFDGLTAGTYDLMVRTPGFEAIEHSGIRVARDHVEELNIQVEEVAIPLQEMVVTPSTYALLQWEPSVFQIKNRQQISRTPHLGDDVYRTISMVPGANTDDLSAKFNVRGAPNSQVLVLLDGMELYSPFHAQDMSGIFSIVDSEAIGSLTLMTGGFASEFGGKMGGVLDMESAVPASDRTEIGLNFSHFRFLSEGVFSEGLGHYVVSARAGNLAPLLFLAEASRNELEVLNVPIPGPSYYDAMGKLSWQFNDRFGAACHFLIAHDTFEEDGENDDFQFGDALDGALNTRYTQDYVWIDFRSDWSADVSTKTLVYFSDSSRSRHGFESGLDFDLSVDDERSYETSGIKQDWRFSLGTRHYLKFGWEVRKVTAQYDYAGSVRDEAPLLRDRNEVIQHVLDLDGEEWRVYLANRMRLTDRVVLELGLRYDTQDYRDTPKVSPRVHFAFNLSPKTTLFAAWGVYHQHQALNELQVEDDVSSFFPTERSDHTLLAAEHRFGWGMTARLEGYHKDLREQRLRFENIYHNAVFFPEFEEDRMPIDAPSGEAYGLECLVRQVLGKRLSCFFNYAYSIAEDHQNGQTIPKRQNQEHTINTELNFRISTTWNVNLIWKYHSGWPTTDLILVLPDSPDEAPGVTLGPLYAENYPDYRRLDLRLSRRKHLSGGHGLTFFVDLNNIGDHPNPRGIENVALVVDENGQVVLEEDIDQGLGFLPSLGLTWVF